MYFDPEAYREFLGAELARRTQANPRYSQRAFARQLGMSPGEFSEILRAKRPLSLKGMIRIAKSLGLLQPGEAPSAKTTPVSLDLFTVVADWYCFAILNLAETRGFRWDDAWIAGRLGISVNEVRSAMSRLLRVGIVEKVRGRFRVVKDFVMSPDGIPSEAIRNYHRQILTKAISALDGQTLDEREISGITFAVDPRLIPALKKELSGFLDEIGRRYGSGKRAEEVYQLELALFRLSEHEGGKVA